MGRRIREHIPTRFLLIEKGYNIIFENWRYIINGHSEWWVKKKDHKAGNKKSKKRRKSYYKDNNLTYARYDKKSK